MADAETPGETMVAKFRAPTPNRVTPEAIDRAIDDARKIFQAMDNPRSPWAWR